ncbi:MAG: hypothetical protein HUU43_11915 [Ignavibacteriaceae bacterium]|nr:hypothetical protein [Ignavibacteriaceae bacterium]
MKFFAVFIILVSMLHAQEMKNLIAKNVKPAYEKGTRAYDGRPGKNYVQNFTDYKINAEFNPVTGVLNGNIKIDYKNNFPDTLKEIVIRLYQDAFKKGNARDFQINPADVHDGVKISRLAVAGKEVNTNPDSGYVNRYGTLMVIPVKQGIAGGSSLKLEIDWQVQIPQKSTVRMGKYGDYNYFIAYWYPQVAVYDDIDGWDKISHTFQQEFYNGFANFDVTLTLPDDYMMWATGVFQNPGERLTSKYLERFEAAFKSDSVVKIITSEDLASKDYLKNSGSNKWHFKAEYVPDFAFGVSNGYLWDGVGLTVDKKTGRRAFIQAAYNPLSEDFYTVCGISYKAIRYFSEDMPGVPYPYPTMTVFNGGGGMEFPMMVNDGSVDTWASAVGLTSHEIAHTYFPFYMGINEVKYAWMDEGFAVMLPVKFQTENAENNFPGERTAKNYSASAGNETEVPPIYPSYVLNGYSYRVASYLRPGTAYLMLEDYLGRESFRAAMQEYIRRWNGKHPIPYDFFYTFNDYLGEDLTWFFKPWFFERGAPDLAITEVRKEKDMTVVRIENHGVMPLPIKLKVYDASGKVIVTKEEKASVWKDGYQFVEIELDKSVGLNAVSYRIDDPNIPDITPGNNKWEKR